MKKSGKVITALVIILAAALLVGLLGLNKKQTAGRSAELKERAETLKTEQVSAASYAEAASDTDENTDGVTDGETDGDGTKLSSADSSEAAESVAAVSSSSGMAEGETKTEAAGSISFRGDSFSPEGDGKSVVNFLQERLEAEGSSQKVTDATFDMSGSLSQLWYAGIDDQTLDAYISAHEKEGFDETNNLTEVSLRSDRDEIDRTRDDQGDLPVICIGYYGGWGKDLDELIEQQQAVLETYSNQDRFIICGFYPYQWENNEQYDKKLEEKWGDHYLPLNHYVSSAGFTEDGRKEIADSIYVKMTQLGYVEK